MKKSLLLMFALLVLGGVNSYATRVYADLSQYGSKWDGTDVSFSWTTTTGNQLGPALTEIGLPKGDLRAYTKLVIETDEIMNADFFRILVYSGTDTNHSNTLKVTSTNKMEFTLAGNVDYLDNVTKIILSGSNWDDTQQGTWSTTPASFKVKAVYLEKPYEGLVFNDNGVATVSITDLVYDSNVTIDLQTGVMSTISNGNITLNVGDMDLTDVSNIKLVHEDAEEGKTCVSNLKFYNADGNQVWGALYNNVYNRDITEEQAAEYFSHLGKIVWNCYRNDNTEPITTTLKYVQITLRSVLTASDASEVAMNTLPSYQKDGGTYVAATTYKPAYRINEATGAAYFGVDWNGEQLNYYTDLEGYKSIRVYQPASSPTVRCIFFNATASGTQTFESQFTWNSKGYYELDLATVKAAVGDLRLISIRPQSGQTSSVTRIVATRDTNFKYALSGKGLLSATATAALADATATSYDATGLTGTGLELTPANPNALFVANAGALSNTQNVITSGTCANLVLTDNHPFKAPADFTATSASYTTTINATAQAGTLCLPFAATLPTGVTAYALAYTSGDEATATPVNGSVTANTPVLINGSDEVTFTGSGVVEADADNVYEAMTGVFEATTVPENSYVLQNGDSGVGFYKVSSSDPITIKPFRAYLTAKGSNAALRIVYPGDATGIEAVEAVADSKDDAFYTLSGVRVSHPVKGLYIKNGKKVMVK